ncbi:hypothetical protein IG631_13048 [Alternaria alternata]|nr:hypothetical protein IG631_13048 [Alternaria alternata]
MLPRREDLRSTPRRLQASSGVSYSELLHYVEGAPNTRWPKASSVRKVAASLVRHPVVELK